MGVSHVGVLLALLLEGLRTAGHQAGKGLLSSVHAHVVLKGVRGLATAIAEGARETRI